MSPLRQSDKETLFLIDGSGFVFRAYHALPPLTRSDGTPIGAVLGFTNMLVKILTDMQAHYLAVIFDAGRRTFRNDLYPNYKANRRETPEDLIPQFPLIRQACQAFGVPLFEKEGVEADDIIATYAAQQKEREVIIVSSDKDLMQLVSDRVKLYDPIKNKIIDTQGVYEKFEVAPTQVIDVQSLAGDSSDNIPGVPGIGIKTAATLIQEFGTLENLLENAHTIKQEKRRASLIQFKEQAELSKKLVTLKTDVTDLPLPSSLRVGTIPESSVSSFLDEQGFRTLKKRLFNEPLKDASPEKKSSTETPAKEIYDLILRQEDLKRWVDQVKKAKVVAVDTETDSLDAKAARLVGLSLAVKPGVACYIPIQFNPQLSLLEPKEPRLEMSQEIVLKEISVLLSDPQITKIGHNIKYDKLVLKQYDVEVVGYEDTMLLSYLQKSGRQGLDYLTEVHFDHHMLSFTDIVGVGKKALTFDQVPLEKALDYAASDADYTYRLYELLKPQLESQRL